MLGTPTYLAERVAFLRTASDRDPRGFTADRGEFLGREGNTGSPCCPATCGPGGTARAGLDPCGAFQVHLDIGPGEEVETFFVLGTGRMQRMHELVRTWRDPARVEEAWQQLGALGLPTRCDRGADALQGDGPDAQSLGPLRFCRTRSSVAQASISRVAPFGFRRTSFRTCSLSPTSTPR